MQVTVRNLIRRSGVYFIKAAALLLPVIASASMSPTHLICEYLSNPLGIDVLEPRLAWQLEANERRQHQTSYQILVAGSKTELNDGQGYLWDTGKVESDQTCQIPYTGKPLSSRETCFWKVRVWDKDGKSSDWSKPASWEMGLLSESDWQGKWIGRTSDTNSNPAPLLRRSFDVSGKIKKAR